MLVKVVLARDTVTLVSEMSQFLHSVMGCKPYGGRGSRRHNNAAQQNNVAMILLGAIVCTCPGLCMTCSSCSDAGEGRESIWLAMTKCQRQGFQAYLLTSLFRAASKCRFSQLVMNRSKEFLWHNALHQTHNSSLVRGPIMCTNITRYTEIFYSCLRRNVTVAAMIDPRPSNHQPSALPTLPLMRTEYKK